MLGPPVIPRECRVLNNHEGRKRPTTLTEWLRKDGHLEPSPVQHMCKSPQGQRCGGGGIVRMAVKTAVMERYMRRAKPSGGLGLRFHRALGAYNEERLRVLYRPWV